MKCIFDRSNRDTFSVTHYASAWQRCLAMDEGILENYDYLQHGAIQTELHSLPPHLTWRQRQQAATLAAGAFACKGTTDNGQRTLDDWRQTDSRWTGDGLTMATMVAIFEQRCGHIAFWATVSQASRLAGIHASRRRTRMNRGWCSSLSRYFRCQIVAS